MEAKQKKHTALKVCLLVLLVVVLAACGYGWHLYSQVAPALSHGASGKLEQQIDPAILEANGERFYNLLVFGLDYDEGATDRDYAEGNGNTDVIMYVQIDRDANKINVFQIPRDTYYGEDMGDGIKPIQGKINEVYAHGPDKKNKINNLANKIGELFQLPVDDYVSIDMNAFKTMINNMGGIDMYVPWDVVTIDKQTGTENLVCSQGQHRISGDTAELILRNRNYGTGDYKRLETQQYFYASLIKTFLNDYTIADYYDTCKVVAHYINTSLDISEIWGLYSTMLHVKPEDIFVVRAPGGAAHINGHEWVYYVDRDSCADILNEHFRKPDSSVPAEKLGLITGQTYISGMNVDEGRTMGSVIQASEEGQAQLEAAGQPESKPAE